MSNPASSAGKSGWKRSFFTIVTGQSVSLIGSAAVQFSLIWWLASETASPMMLALAGLFEFIPHLLLGPFAGVWIDRLHRKTVIIAADLFAGICAALFAVLFLIDTPPIWAVCLLLAMRSVSNTFHTPATQAAIPMLVPADQLVRANGWSQFMQSGSFMLGPVLGAAMFAALPLWLILLTDLLGAVIAASCVAVVHIPDPPRAETVAAPHFLREMKEGALALLVDRKLFIMISAATLGMVFYLPLSSFYPLMSSDYFNATAWHGGFVELAYASGMMLCALIFGQLGNLKHKIRVAHYGMFGLGLTALLCGLLPPDLSIFWIFAVLCALMGASGNVYNIPCMAYLQETIPAEKQGRAFSLIGSMASMSMPLGLLIAGPISEKYGVVMWFFIAGIAFLVITTISLLLISSKRLSAHQ